MIYCTASIVLYNNPSYIISKAIDSLFNENYQLKLYLIDNSPSDDLKTFQSDKIVYVHNPSNPGFGAAHNIAINLAITDESKYHFIVNPDIYFKKDVITPMINYMTKNLNVGMMMPQILNPDGSIQYLPKILPNPFSILLRKIKFPRFAYNNFINTYELRFVDEDIVYTAPIISGCFTLLRIKAVQEVGNYDDDYFMYFEDWDLSRRMNRKYNTIYFPNVAVYHEYASGANKSFKLFKIYSKSAIRYFNKWGWFFDKKRDELNERTLAQFK